MKRNISLILVIVAVTAAGLALAPTVGAKIGSSVHDFSAETWNTGGEICAPCHTPHFADTTVANAPLWDHDLSSATYDMYDSTHSGTIDGTVDSSPGSISALCLSCHDGTVGLDAFGGGTATTYIGDITGTTAELGTDLTQHHPISITYSPGSGAGQDPGLHATTNTVATGITVADLLYSSKVECGSCHDVHDEGPAAAGHLLRVDNAASALCLGCHDK